MQKAYNARLKTLSAERGIRLSCFFRNRKTAPANETLPLTQEVENGYDTNGLLIAQQKTSCPDTASWFTALIAHPLTGVDSTRWFSLPAIVSTGHAEPVNGYEK